MGILRRRWVWMKRFRHRRGYGVHSPSAFDFLTYVVYERGEYYAYGELRRRHFVPAYWWGGHVVKCRKFLFRLANYVHPDRIRLYGDVDDASADYLRAGCISASVCHDSCPADAEVHNVRDAGTELLFVGGGIAAERWADIVGRVKDACSVCVLNGIHASDGAYRQWKRVQQLPQVFVSYDLYDFGILFFDSSKQKQHYIVNF